MYRRFAALLLSIGMIAGLGAVSVAPAAASASTNTSYSAQRTHTCVDSYEYNHVYYGNHLGSIERFFDTSGWVVWRSGRWALKKYYACGYWNIVKVKYWWNGYAWTLYSKTRW